MEKIIKKFIDYLLLEKKYSKHTVLAYQKDIASSRYGDMLNIYSNEEVDEVKNARNALIKVKSLLYMHPLVREYLDAFQIVRAIYRDINKNIFALMDTDMCPQEED